jgi:K+-transporting ATPase KdpF subunit
VRRLRAFLREDALKKPISTHPRHGHRTTVNRAMENIVISLIALGCLVYLIVAVLRPEKF